MINKKYGDPIRIEEAYNYLSSTTFAAFVKILDDGKIDYTRMEVSKIIEKSRATTTRILRELSFLDCIKIKNQGNGKRTIFSVYRRLIIEKSRGKFAIL